MSKIRFVPSDGLPGFLAAISSDGSRIFVPVEKKSSHKPSVVFEKWEKGQEFTLAKANVSAKMAVLPESEVLLDFRMRKGDASDNRWEIGEPDKIVSTVVFGCRPCDARGFDCLDKPYLHGLYPDQYYLTRREHLTVISFTCNTGCETCFCHWVGIGPTSPSGSDILATSVDGGYVLQAITEQGERLLERSGAAEGADRFPEAEAVRKSAWASLKKAPDISAAAQSLEALFDNTDFWKRMTSICLSCGACTYFCPTCYCFNITDEGHPVTGGKRLRSWDNCMSSLYTREASGHNPRPEKFQRMRNRVSHKFWTFPANWGQLLCSGCGRCITHCPVHLDIRKIVLAAIAEHSGQTEA